MTLELMARTLLNQQKVSGFMDYIWKVHPGIRARDTLKRVRARNYIIISLTLRFTLLVPLQSKKDLVPLKKK